MINKLSYLYLIINLKLIFILTFFLRKFSFLYNPKVKKHDLILFPFSQKGSDGYTRRFEEYFTFLQNDKIDYYVSDFFNNEYIIKNENSSERNKYKLYRNIAWIRLKQVLMSRKYKAAFIHRGLFPYYPDLKKPYFEKLLRKLNNNITIDFWDSVWEYSDPKLIKETVKFCDKISVVNTYIENYFEFSNKKKYIFPIGVNTSKYKQKKNFILNEPIKFFYTGGPGNVKQFLKLIHPILVEINLQYKLKLIIVSRDRTYIDGIEIEYYNFDEKFFFNLLFEADIGLYMIKKNSISEGKMAMKVLDYMSTALPIIATNSGVTPHAENNHNILFAENNKEWIEKIKVLIKDNKLRKKIGENAIETVNKHHTIEKSYNQLVKIINI